MGSLSIWHWVIIIGLLVLVFGGKGKVSDLMGDVAKGIKSFKKGLADEDADGKAIEAQVEQGVNKASDKKKV